ncbi:MAG: hypothetical protein KDD02_10920 [Phaeodactylibacter sp.]|nr:hypothetical protein [Phaeodactylibacter sp.]MCB9300600.1 hypothetical protein [Lewinellaceae bacterium]
MKARHLVLPLLFPATFFVASCQNQPSSGQPEQSNKQADTQPAENTPTGQPLVFTDAGQLPAGVSFEGKFLQGARWESQGVTYYGLVSKYEQGEFFSPGWVSRLHIYLYEILNGQVASRKAFEAEAPNIYSEASLNEDRTKVVNLPSIGSAFSIVYSICPDGEDPCTVYSTVIGDKGKYDFQVMDNVDKNIYFYSRDEIMEGIPEDVQVHMLEQLFPEK